MAMALQPASGQAKLSGGSHTCDVVVDDDAEYNAAIASTSKSTRGNEEYTAPMIGWCDVGEIFVVAC